MREMTISKTPWISEYPADWKQIPLHALFAEHKNKNKNGAERNLLSLSYGRIIRKDINSNEGLLPESFNGYNIIENGDIVLRLTDLQNDHRSLRTGLATERGIITSAYVTLRNKVPLSSEYYHYLLHAFDIMKVFYTMGEGVRQSLGYDEMASVLIPQPSLHEQHAIVSYLDKKCAAIDEAIARRQQMNEKLEEYRRAIVNQMLSTSEWPLVPLKYVVTYNDEKLSECTDPDFSFDYIDIGSVMYKYGLQYTQRMAFKDAPSRARRIVRNDDVILSTVRTYLKASVRITGIEYPTVASTGFITMRARKQKIVPDYLGYLVQWDGLVSEVEKRSYGTSYPAITAGEIVNIAVPVPSISKQRDAVKHLDEKCSLVDDIYARNIELINRLEEYRKSIIYNAVTGKIDCREVV